MLSPARIVALIASLALAAGCSDECFVDGPGCSGEQPGFYAVTVGASHGCGLRTNQIVACWGLDQDGSATPPPESFTAIAAGARHTCGLTLERGIECWGSQDLPQARAPGGTLFGDGGGGGLVAGANHNCVIETGTSVRCWGSNDLGQVLSPAGYYNEVGTGADHSCANDGYTGQLACWGRNDAGQATPPAVDGRLWSVTGGDSHTCALTLDRTVVCWGGNPDDVAPPGGTFDALSAGRTHTCGIRPGGAVECWGDDTDGKATPPDGAFDSIAAGDDHTCGVSFEGTILCWGNNDDGQSSPP